jgi:hypothetical protein
MKHLILGFAIFCSTQQNLFAQEVIKTGEETSITCTGILASTVQHYFRANEPSSKGKTFVDFTKDSIVIFEAFVDDGSSHAVYRRSVAKKDINASDDGFSIEKTKENDASFLLLRFYTKEQKDLVKVQFHARSEIEQYDPVSYVTIYFAVDKEVDGNTWKEKIKQAVN